MADSREVRVGGGSVRYDNGQLVRKEKEKERTPQLSSSARTLVLILPCV